ncbi:beta-lactamase family protein [Nocardia tengchongensis]|uniref:Beta-lactamase family protein n=1 Tax=Nocardia tengchongensis TaxID=2055889 RepID=A0ABX8CPF3_9NOCA|nr:serine hydrolase domain-containing protein [Nocardia tengchongensis]QVI21802.1 beta-lactamase family protein [Nocardia tengchongensis]
MRLEGVGGHGSVHSRSPGRAGTNSSSRVGIDAAACRRLQRETGSDVRVSRRHGEQDRSNRASRHRRRPDTRSGRRHRRSRPWNLQPCLRFRRRRHRTGASVSDHYRVGSITKTFTATAVLRLADDGKLSLEDRLSRYVEGVPYGDTITIRDLLGMRGGVYDFAADPEFAPQVRVPAPDRSWTTDDTLRVIRTHADKAQPPNTRTAYSNSEYYLLGLVLERATGRPVGEVINGLARDYGLDARYPNDTTVPTPESRGYAYAADVLTDVTTRTSPAVWGAAGAMTSTVTDLAAYAPVLTQGKFLQPETLRERTTFTAGTDAGTPMDYGLGLMRSGMWLGHTGAVLGDTAVTLYLPDRKISVAVVANQYEPSYKNLLPISALSIWQDIVVRLYPETVPWLTAPPSTSDPKVPSPAELTDQLRNTLDPTIPAAGKQLRASGDDKDPELTTKLARAYTGATVTVDKTTDHGDRIMYATARIAVAQKTVPMIIGFQARDGGWQLSNAWSCQQLALAGENSPACS